MLDLLQELFRSNLALFQGVELFENSLASVDVLICEKFFDFGVLISQFACMPGTISELIGLLARASVFGTTGFGHGVFVIDRARVLRVVNIKAKVVIKVFCGGNYWLLLSRLDASLVVNFAYDWWFRTSLFLGVISRFYSDAVAG